MEDSCHNANTMGSGSADPDQTNMYKADGVIWLIYFSMSLEAWLRASENSLCRRG